MRIARDITADYGMQMLSPKQMRMAALPRVLSMFAATGLSESERLETAYMLQKFILEGYLKGVDVPKLLEHRSQLEGLLHVGFKDGSIPNRNTILLDRNNWRSQPVATRVSDFMNKLGTRLSSSVSVDPHPHNNYAPRQFQEAPRSGPIRSKLSSQVSEQIATRVISAVAPSRLNGVFSDLKQTQTQMGFTPPQQIFAPRYTQEGFSHQRTNALMDQQTENLFETRQEMIQRGADPVETSLRAARSGLGSPRNTSGVGLGEQLAGSNRPNKIFIYSGPGTWSEEIQNAKRDAESIGIQVEVRSSLSGVDWNQFGAVIFPGGTATTQFNSLPGSEVSRLKQAIQGGLNFMGHCAGAFLAGNLGLGLVNQYFDYPSTYYGGGNQITVKNSIKWGNDPEQYMLFYGGPDLSGSGRTLAEHPSGADTITSTNYGQGHVILTAGHPSVQGPNDPDGADNELYKQLLRAIVAGTDPDQVPPGPGPGPGPGPSPNKPPDINIPVERRREYETNPTAVNPGASMDGTVGPGRMKNRAPHRKTPVAGSLNPQILDSSFAAGLNDIVRKSSPMLQGMAGALQGLKV